MKTAFMTMDVESLYDTECLKDRKIPFDKEFSGEEFIDSYVTLLDKYNIKGTFFTLVSSMDLAKESLKKIVRDGHEIALHGLDHTSPLEMNTQEFEENIIKAKEILEENLNTNITGYRAPCFGITDDFVEVLRKNGFKYDSSSLNFHLAIASGKLDLSSYERINDSCYKKDDFYEITPNRVKAYGGHLPVSGGGYIRLVPWFVIRYYIKKCIKKTDCYMFYVHPFELSRKKAPKIKGLKFVEWLFLRIGRRAYLHKIEKIIQYLKKRGFEFKSMKEFTS